MAEILYTVLGKNVVQIVEDLSTSGGGGLGIRELGLRN